MHCFPPLAPEQRALYATAIEQTEAIFALEYMVPDHHDQTLKVAILTGQVSPEDARERLLTHLIKYKTRNGFKLQATHSNP